MINQTELSQLVMHYNQSMYVKWERLLWSFSESDSNFISKEKPIKTSIQRMCEYIKFFWPSYISCMWKLILLHCCCRNNNKNVNLYLTKQKQKKTWQRKAIFQITFKPITYNLPSNTLLLRLICYFNIK